jgi:hypothetical protein
MKTLILHSFFMKKILVFMGYLAGFLVGAKYAKKPGKTAGK